MGVKPSNHLNTSHPNSMRLLEKHHTAVSIIFHGIFHDPSENHCPMTRSPAMVGNMDFHTVPKYCAPPWPSESTDDPRHKGCFGMGWIPAGIPTEFQINSTKTPKTAIRWHWSRNLNICKILHWRYQRMHHSQISCMVFMYMKQAITDVHDWKHAIDFSSIAMFMPISRNSGACLTIEQYLWTILDDVDES